MKNSNESSNNLKVVAAGLQPAETLEQGIIADSSKAGKKVLPEQRRTMLEGEMVVQLGEHTSIQENGVTLSRFGNTSKKTIVSKAILASESKKATNKYMKEKGLTSIEEIIESSKEQVPQMPKIDGQGFTGIIAEDGTIIRDTVGSER